MNLVYQPREQRRYKNNQLLNLTKWNEKEYNHKTGEGPINWVRWYYDEIRLIAVVDLQGQVNESKRLTFSKYNLIRSKLSYSLIR